MDLYGYISAIQNAIWVEVFRYLDAPEDVDFPQDVAMFYNSMDEAHGRLHEALGYLGDSGSVHMDNASLSIQSACESLATASLYAKKAGDEHSANTAYVYWLALDFADDYIVGS